MGLTSAVALPKWVITTEMANKIALQVHEVVERHYLTMNLCFDHSLLSAGASGSSPGSRSWSVAGKITC